MPSQCRAKLALLKGIRPSLSSATNVATTQGILSSSCRSSCIYCDIWRLATMIASHVPLTARYNLTTYTPASSPTSSTPSSPISRSPPLNSSLPHAAIISASKRIEAQLQQQRSQLNSILSICSVSGVDQTEGLRMAHDRCSQAIEDLLDREEDLEEDLLRDMEEMQYVADYECGAQYNYGRQERRPSLVPVSF
ncbi:hypothetical protein PV10_04458 [Exophiala mesophila]|uniref:Uncharacterized protein n=1 Tax=Exophiala mesophila TaxID=212818 RepID=A0A0D1ZER5_EXOME|nr:uncharacterized protein PV10_04458 [Exophiala mesophila]KIV93227.1 hypothetical protein PV10_04458 [Exophiala mesophila]